MPDTYVLRTASILVAASIAGTSPRTFRKQFLRTGLVATDDGKPLMASLEQAIGRPVTHEVFCKALSATEHARRAARDHMRQLRAERISP